MIIVTGQPRTGTSLVMQTLGYLGAFPLGITMPGGRVPEKNPGGYFEHPDFLKGDINQLSRNMPLFAVKVTLSAFIKNPNAAPQDGDHVIVCTRSSDDAVQSWIDYEPSNAGKNVERLKRRHETLYAQIPTYPQMLYVSLENMQANPAQVVNDIAAFTGLPQAVEARLATGIQDAIANVR